MDLWQVYVEWETPSLQDTEDLDLIEHALRGRANVVRALPAVGSQGEKYSVAATILLHAADSELAADHARAMFAQTCVAAGYAIGRLSVLSAQPADVAG